MYFANRDVQQHAQGWVFIHACRRAFASHIETALHVSLVDFGAHERLPQIQWQEQPAMARHWRLALKWQGTGLSFDVLRRSLQMFPGIYAEVTCEPTAEADGARLMLVPDLGFWFGQMDRAGNVTVNEVQLRRAMSLPPEQMRAHIAQLLGSPWDEQLEPLRSSGACLPAANLRAM